MYKRQVDGEVEDVGKMLDFDTGVAIASQALLGLEKEKKIRRTVENLLIAVASNTNSDSERMILVTKTEVISVELVKPVNEQFVNLFTWIIFTVSGKLGLDSLGGVCQVNPGADWRSPPVNPEVTGRLHQVTPEATGDSACKS